MNTAETIEQAQVAIARLPREEQKKVFRSLSRQLEGDFSGIEKDPNVMGGAACVRGTRIPLWVLYRARQQSVSEADLLRNYPGLTAEDLVNAWDYAAVHRDELESEIKENESDG